MARVTMQHFECSAGPAAAFPRASRRLPEDPDCSTGGCCRWGAATSENEDALTRK
jgi:hypothetical protein